DPASGVPSAEGRPDLRRRHAQPRNELDGAHQRQPRGGTLDRHRSDHLIATIAHRHGDAGDAEHVFFVVDRVADADDPGELGLEHRPVGEGALGEALQRHPLERSEEHTSELQSHLNLVCRLLLEKKKKRTAVSPMCGPRSDTRTKNRGTKAPGSIISLAPTGRVGTRTSGPWPWRAVRWEVTRTRM